MSNLKAKMKKEGGFTLIEMLIVVAIIAILIAIAIPMVNKALEKSREATDSANMRAAVGLAYVNYMTDNHLVGSADKGYYNIDNDKGTIVADKSAVTKGYGKGTSAGDQPNHLDQIIEVEVVSGDVVGNWVTK